MKILERKSSVYLVHIYLFLGQYTDLTSSVSIIDLGL